jgi:16S rRNA processing protein RimM
LSRADESIDSFARFLLRPMIAGLEAAEMPADAIEVGRIADAWGVKGWFKVLPHSADPEALFSSKCWYLLPTERGQKTFEGCAQLLVKEAKEHSSSVVATAQDVLDRNAAEALRGCRIFVSRASFPVAAKDEYYWVDLIGLAVINRQDELLGVVKELLSTGAQTVLVLEYTEEDGKPQERMIPFVSAYVDDVDLVARHIRVDWLKDY